MKIIIAAALAACAVLGLTSCSSGGSPDSDGSAGDTLSSLYERTISLTDGRTVTCIVYIGGYKGGLSCDWDGAAR